MDTPTFYKFKPFTGPSSYSFQDPDTGIYFNSPTREDLMRHIVLYRRQNDLPAIEELGTVIENYLCMQEENQGKCTPHDRLKRGLVASLRGGIALLKNYMYSSFAHQQVADTRAEQCVKCPLNTFPDKGPFIEAQDKLAQLMVGERRSKYHDQLGTCAGCGCPMRAKVFYTGKVTLSPEEESKMRAVACWQLGMK